MPFVSIEGLHCHYRLDGRDDRPVLVLAHSLGLDLGMWDEQLSDLTTHFLVLRYDLRGHGASSAPAGDYTIEQLSRDALALVDALHIGAFALCGVSIGGMIGQWLATHAGDRITRLVLANTSPRVAEPAAMEARRLVVLERGTAAIAETVMSRFFSPVMIAANPPRVASARRTLLSTDAVGYAGCCAALRDSDLHALLGLIRVPTLVISGDADVSMPWVGHGEVLATSIAGARAVRLPTAHLSNLATPRAFSTCLLEFLVGDADGSVEAGMAVRRAVLGHAHVDRAVASTTEITRDFQQLIARFAWGTVWARPGLDHRTRRMLTLAITGSIGRWEEFRLHVRTALDAGFEPCDLEEVLLTVAVYAGIPAANTGFHVVAEELRERAPDRPGTGAA
jgi:3-oxoadipate enol-lactonase/4-carboxymuconolactone decarboxylase